MPPWQSGVAPEHSTSTVSALQLALSSTIEQVAASATSRTVSPSTQESAGGGLQGFGLQGSVAATQTPSSQFGAAAPHDDSVSSKVQAAAPSTTAQVAWASTSTTVEASAQ